MLNLLAIRYITLVHSMNDYSKIFDQANICNSETKGPANDLFIAFRHSNS